MLSERLQYNAFAQMPKDNTTAAEIKNAFIYHTSGFVEIMNAFI